MTDEKEKITEVTDEDLENVSGGVILVGDGESRKSTEDFLNHFQKKIKEGVPENIG